MRMETEELYVKSEAEMRQVFPSLPDAIDRAAEIAQRCHETRKLVVMEPVPRLLELDHLGIAEMGDAPILFRVRCPAVRA